MLDETKLINVLVVSMLSIAFAFGVLCIAYLDGGY